MGECEEREQGLPSPQRSGDPCRQPAAEGSAWRQSGTEGSRHRTEGARHGIGGAKRRAAGGAWHRARGACRLALAAGLAKLVRWLTQLVTHGHGGTSLPGKLVLRLAPQAISDWARQIRRGVVVVTGTNGKTSTSHLVRRFLQNQGYRVAANTAGANLLGGVASCLALATDRWGHLTEVDYAVLEVDERVAEAVVEAAAEQMRALIVTNILRDQLDRLAEPELVRAAIGRAVGHLPGGACLLLNADDPGVARLAQGAPQEPAQASSALPGTAGGSGPAASVSFYGLNEVSFLNSDDSSRSGRQGGPTQGGPALDRRQPDAPVSQESLTPQGAPALQESPALQGSPAPPVPPATPAPLVSPGPSALPASPAPSTAAGGLDEVKDSDTCPRCGHRLDYSQRFYSHLGHYQCPQCGWQRPEPRWWVNAQAKGVTTQTGEPGWFVDLYRTAAGEAAGQLAAGEPIAGHLDLEAAGVHQLYNLLAAAAAVAEVTGSVPVRTGERIEPRVFGRMERIALGPAWGGRELLLALSKNPTGTNQNLRTFVDDPRIRVLAFILNDRVADGRDISWIWDVDWRRLADRNDWALIASGRRAAEAALCWSYYGVSPEQIRVQGRLDQIIPTVAAATPPGSRCLVLATYTAMLDFRRLLARTGKVKVSWYWQQPARQP